MPISQMASEHGVFAPEDVAMLRRVFAEACREQVAQPDAATCKRIAARIITSLKRGRVDEQELLRDAVLGFEEPAP